MAYTQVKHWKCAVWGHNGVSPFRKNSCVFEFTMFFFFFRALYSGLCPETATGGFGLEGAIGVSTGCRSAASSLKSCCHRPGLAESRSIESGAILRGGWTNTERERKTQRERKQAAEMCEE